MDFTIRDLQTPKSGSVQLESVNSNFKEPAVLSRGQTVISRAEQKASPIICLFSSYMAVHLFKYIIFRILFMTA